MHLVLQKAMRRAEAAGTEDCPVKMKLVAAPLYVLTTQTLDKVGVYVLSLCWAMMAYALPLLFPPFFSSPFHMESPDRNSSQEIDLMYLSWAVGWAN